MNVLLTLTGFYSIQTYSIVDTDIYTDIDDSDLVLEIIEDEEDYINTIPELFPNREVEEGEVEEVEKVEETVEYKYNLTESEKYMLATLVRLEAGGQSWECQCAVASVVINRLNRQYGGKTTLQGIIYAKGQFSPAHRIKRNNPSQMQLDVVEYVCKNGVTIPEDVVYFHYRHYGKWGKPYCSIGTEYFSRG